MTWERALTDPITTAIATAVAGSAATALTAEAARILKDIAARIRHKLHGDPDAPAIPADPRDADSSPEDIASLAGRLRRAFQEEPDFETEITALWENFRRAAGNTYTNNFYGNAHTSVIVGEHHGDLNING